ncbi:MAG: acetyltransferase, family [Myxococcales bacterium]|nr:acetyltransferase, family [Myxococcales bacterium]
MASELSPAEILVEVVESPRRAYAMLDDLRVIDRPGWIQLITPSFRQGGFNEVAHAELAAEDADQVIAATIAEYRALGIKFRWVVGPGSRPADLGERLARAGLVASYARGMARSTEMPTEAAGHAITVEPVDLANVDVYTRAMAEGWATDPGPLARAHAAVLAETPRTQHLFLARVDGEPAASAAYVAFPRSAYLLGGVVLPRFRRRGVYHALVAHRLADARARGITLATSRAAEESSAPLLERLGFATVCRFASYTLTP